MFRNFSLNEFTASASAIELGINNTVPEDLEDNALVTLQMMQDIRDHLSAVRGKDIPITITSGFRSAKLNKAVGGAVASDHLRAMAVDFRAPLFGTPLQIAKELSGFVDALGIGQLINEHPERGMKGWVHVSTRKPMKIMNRVITITDKGSFVGIHTK